jgi:hypothetical protein
MIWLPESTWGGEYDAFLRLRFASPALMLVTLPPATPQPVADAVKAAAAALWLDPGAAANRLRLAVEELLTAQRVPRFSKSSTKRIRMSTHQRIATFRNKHADAADALEAVKWIGNEGSHAGELGVKDVLEGARILGFALRLIYDDEDQQIARRIRKVNKSRGLPPRR